MRSLRTAAACSLLLASLAVADPTPAPTEPPAAATQAPSGLPEDLPLYAGAVAISSMSSPTRGTIVNLRSSDAPVAIFDWYRAELARRGWFVAKQDGAGAQHLVVAHKGGRKASLLISAKPAAGDAEPESQILLVVTEDE